MTMRGLRSRFPRAGSPAGAQKKLEFIAAISQIMGDVRAIWMPNPEETIVSTDLSRHTGQWEYNATFAGKYSTLGSGTSATFDGTADEADKADNDRYSPGNSKVDEPFSIVALVNPTDGTPAATAVILGKFDQTTATPLREWLASISATDGYPSLALYDESANTSLVIRDGTAVTSGAWVLLVFTYDGSGADTGINIFKNGVRVDDTSNSSGTYVAMENSATKPMLGANIVAGGSAGSFWAGGMALVGQCAKQLLVHDAEALTQLCNGYFDLEL